MTTQRKEQLLKELDVALNRKVQQKYYKNAKTQQIPNLSQAEYAADRYKKESHIDSRQYTTREQKSPIHLKKSVQKVNEFRYQKSLDPEQSHAYPEKARSSQNIKEQGKQQQLRQEISTLQNENIFLANQLDSFKKSIQQLEQESRLLKRQETQYLALKEQNTCLSRQNEQLKRKLKGQVEPTKDNSLISNLSFEEALKNMMMQLNLSFLAKQWNDSFVLEAVKSISKEVNKLIEDKSKLTSKLKKFDIDSVLAKENNVSYKQQVAQMRDTLSNYEAELEACKATISEMDEQFNLIVVKNKQLQKVNKEAGRQLEQVTKELDASKKQFKMVFESSRHRKPKRESSVIKRDKERQSLYDDSTVIRSTTEVSSQTQIKQQSNQQQQEDQYHFSQYQKQLEILRCTIEELKLTEGSLKKELTEKNEEIQRLTVKIDALEEEKLDAQTKIVDLQQKSYHCEHYIKQLELKSEQINTDLSHFMPQLKQMEQQNNQLKQSHLHKDEQIIKKHRAICQLSNKNQQLHNQIQSLQSSLQTNRIELEGKSRQIEHLNQQLIIATGKNSELQTSMLQKENSLQQSFNHQIAQLNIQISKKDSQIEQNRAESQSKLKNMRKQLDECQQQLQQAKSMGKKQLDGLREFKSKLEQKSDYFRAEKEKLKEAIQQIMIMNSELTKKQTQYESICHTLEGKVLSFQAQSNQVTQSYSQLQISLKKMDQQIQAIKRQNQNLVNQQESSATQVRQLKMINETLKNDLQVNQKLQAQKEQAKKHLEAINTQLLSRIEEIQQYNGSATQNIKELQNHNKQLRARLTSLELAMQDKTQECASGQEHLSILSQQNITLSQDLQKIKKQFELNDKLKIRQISNQNYDIERLMRQAQQLMGKLQQTNALLKSKQFQEKQINQKLSAALEDNKSLSVRYEYLKEELEMKDRNKKEDKYLFELKQKQYCLLVKKILSNSIELKQLNYCEDLEQLLEVGSQRIMEKRKSDQEGQMAKGKDAYSNNQYQFNYRHEQPQRRFNFGTQINSYQVLLSSRHHKKVEENLNRGNAKEDPSTPRSFIFNLSPLADRTQKRKEEQSQDLQGCLQKQE